MGEEVAREVVATDPHGEHRRMVVDEVEPRVLGIPTRWLRPPARLDLRALRHPGHWLRWRLERRRLGPYARTFDEVASGVERPAPPGGRAKR